MPLRKTADPVRPHPAGGWYCEVGTAGRGPACSRRATWIQPGGDPARPLPGQVVCDEHLHAPRLWRANLSGPWKPLPDPASEDREPGKENDRG